MVEPWRVISSKIDYEDRWLRVRTDRCVRSKGEVVDTYHVLEYRPWVNVVALTPESEIVLVRQYRHPVQAVLIGLPSGAVEPSDQDPEQAIRRELREETGFTGREFHQIGCTYANAGNQDNQVSSFLAIDVEQTHEQSLDPNEDIEVIREGFIGFIRQVWQGSVLIQALFVASLHFACHFILNSEHPRLEGLRRQLSETLVEGL